jgi:predicted enzyme related to lactoylglutathione lyase
MSELGDLIYLYVGSADVGRDLRFYVEGLGGEQVWRFQAMGADVAGVRLSQSGPLVILADHRPVPSVLPIWKCSDLDQAVASLKAAGWEDVGHRVEVPDGPVLVLTDPSGNQVALLDQIRPNALGGKGSSPS